jgi:hypothetical protein
VGEASPRDSHGFNSPVACARERFLSLLVRRLGRSRSRCISAGYPNHRKTYPEKQEILDKDLKVAIRAVGMVDFQPGPSKLSPGIS